MWQFSPLSSCFHFFFAPSFVCGSKYVNNKFFFLDWKAPEFINGRTGMLINGKNSKLSKISLFERFVCVQNANISSSLPYQEAKILAIDYQVILSLY
jgi:hypothetical protein